MRRWMTLVGLIGVCALTLVSIAQAKVQYVEMTPLTERLAGVSVGDVKQSAVTQLPLITWGGDIATILANGGERQTQANSIFAKQGLKFELVREDVFANQVRNYLEGKTPYLRGTEGMMNMAAEVANKDPRTRIVPFYKMTWSTGGDAIVVKPGIKSVKDFAGKNVAVNLDGPHSDYLAKLLKDAGLTMQDVNIKWTKDLVGFEGNTPTAAFYNDPSIDVAIVIIPDALALTSNGTVGTGSEDSVKGATIMLSTKSAQKIIADVYSVRADYLENHRAEVQKLTHGLMLAQEKLAEIVSGKKTNSGAYQKIMAQSADILLDSPTAIADAEGLYADCTFVGFAGNVEFFGNPNNPRNFDRLTDEIQSAFMVAGILSKKTPMNHAKWDYNLFKSGLKNTAGVNVPKFDKAAVAAIVSKKQQQGTLAEGELFSFEVYFEPNQNNFPPELYGQAFEKVINLASTYGGALITVEGHSDPLEYLKKKKANSPQIVLQRLTQSTKNLSFARANVVRDSVINFAQAKGVTLDPTQFAVVGHGFMSPASGMCGNDPCAPKTKQEWLNNMRVVFRIIQIEAEAAEFQAL